MVHLKEMLRVPFKNLQDHCVFYLQYAKQNINAGCIVLETEALQFG
jgi:hypothetical protein